MPQTAVEVERVDVETLNLCEDCHREIDEDGAVFESSDTDSILYYCSECLAERDVDVTSAQVQRVEDWLESEDSYGDTMRENINMTRVLHLVAMGIAVAATAVIFTGASGWAIAMLGLQLSVLLATSIWLWSVSSP